jgi:hypothetical protein
MTSWGHVDRTAALWEADSAFCCVLVCAFAPPHIKAIPTAISILLFMDHAPILVIRNHVVSNGKNQIDLEHGRKLD